ncbi:MAG: 30S ribosome-binding factor RbfA [Bosea sp. (in: a-proteobacteria)]|uniref:30S ribosome-binding factor RbfA n=1 Tax=unclassified Bosea (in: a-proteobacteria) TaxID=2653178 RepID=UPI000965189A|nr:MULTISPECIES: 30S ribosome-binding factor RbfA [unclassified Bosea (in: a-proteobacteria)]MBN9457565.1 30S ribosome-binding factor RbfA [Bosea sp. (in: a-proteobacteria)]OJV10162.1 MAG: ribosome-binding factor A [Bosea sp. 67-29]
MAKPAKPSGPSQRQLRVGELIRHALAEMLARGDIHDDVLAKHVVTVPEVRLSPDLKLATAYIMPLGGQDIAPVLKALEANKRYIRGEIAHRVNLKYAPDIRFRADESFAEAERIDALLDTEAVRRDTQVQRLKIDQDHEGQPAEDDDRDDDR